jgi:hypothetical protein
MYKNTVENSNRIRTKKRMSIKKRKQPYLYYEWKSLNIHNRERIFESYAIQKSIVKKDVDAITKYTCSV